MERKTSFLLIAILIALVFSTSGSYAAIDVEMILNNGGFESYSHFKAELFLNNHDEELPEAEIFGILEIEGVYYFWPDFGTKVNFQTETIALGKSSVLFLEFDFPDIDDMIPYGPLKFWGAWYLNANRYGYDVAEFWLDKEHKWTPTATPTPAATPTTTGTPSPTATPSWIPERTPDTIPTPSETPTWSPETTPTVTPTPPQDFAYFHSGTFLMGSPLDEMCGRPDEKPVHTVMLTHGFYIQSKEVTQQQWMDVFGNNPSYHRNCMDCPVEEVTWYDCCIYCNRLSQAEGLTPCYYSDDAYTTVFDGTPPVTGGAVFWKQSANGYRLPTEGEWEYACRAGTTTAYNSGQDNTDCNDDPNLDPLGWYWYNSDPGNGAETHPAELKQANNQGLYDMHGNVWEWCWDRYQSDYYGSAPSIDPTGPSSGASRVQRGGGWGSFAEYCRSANRYNGNPDAQCNNLGFRILKSAHFVYIPTGTFQMGSPPDELCGHSDEKPVHNVTLTRGFYIQSTEVTQQQWMDVFGNNPSYHRNCLRCPVEEVTWYDCCIFCNRLSQAEGLTPCYYSDDAYTTVFDGTPPVTGGAVFWKQSANGYRLPTEAEWEYACRVGTTAAYNSGQDSTNCNDDPNLDPLGWYWYNSDTGNGPETHPAGLKQANSRELYDMHGNVWEWCWDPYQSDYYGFSPPTDPTGPSSGASRVRRGGSWDSSAEFCRSANRLYSNLDYRADNLGFRILKSINSIYLHPGTFQMGSPPDELCGHSDEKPVHNVTLTHGFYIQATEVTQQQWMAVFGNNPSCHRNCMDCPVEEVTWYDCCIYCNRLSQAEGLTPCYYSDGSYTTVFNGTPPVTSGIVFWKQSANGYRLPTEAEWEYACRAGTTTAYNSGQNNTGCDDDPNLDPLGWYWYNSDTGNGPETHPAGQKQSNNPGLYDMHGNVWEWCWDRYQSDYYGSAPSFDPTGPSLGASRVQRGGGWDSSAEYCRSANRLYSNLDYCADNLGFRILKSTHFVYFPPGTFQMGSPPDELCGHSDEKPVHNVTLTHGFYIQATEVTQQQWMDVFGNNPSYHRNCLKCPVEEITWYDCCIYCNRLSQAEGLTPCYYSDDAYTTVFDGTPPVTGGAVFWKQSANGYRLPTEAEWEYACRAGTTAAYNSGQNNTDCNDDSNLDPLGWYWYNSDTGNGLETHPAGQKQSNNSGLYDMHGNVWEWCWDRYQSDYYGSAPSTDPTGPSSGSDRVGHGGGWSSFAEHCRSANRSHYNAYDPYHFLGFRILRVAH